MAMVADKQHYEVITADQAAYEYHTDGMPVLSLSSLECVAAGILYDAPSVLNHNANKRCILNCISFLFH